MSNQYDIEVGLISKILESGDFLAVKEKQINGDDIVISIYF